MANFKEELINNLSENIGKLTELYSIVKEDNKRLKNENSDLQGFIKSKEEAYHELETRYNTLKLTKTLMGQEIEGVDVKNKVNNLVREIDKCIALLNR